MYLSTSCMLPGSRASCLDGASSHRSLGSSLTPPWMDGQGDDGAAMSTPPSPPSISSARSSNPSGTGGGRQSSSPAPGGSCTSPATGVHQDHWIQRLVVPWVGSYPRPAGTPLHASCTGLFHPTCGQHRTSDRQRRGSVNSRAQGLPQFVLQSTPTFLTWVPGLPSPCPPVNGVRACRHPTSSMRLPPALVSVTPVEGLAGSNRVKSQEFRPLLQIPDLPAAPYSRALWLRLAIRAFPQCARVFARKSLGVRRWSTPLAPQPG